MQSKYARAYSEGERQRFLVLAKRLSSTERMNENKERQNEMNGEQ